MRQLFIQPAAEAEMAESYQWYEKRLPGLGTEFLLTVKATFERIVHAPETFPLVHKNLRRALTRRFPYQVFFLVKEDRIVVIAVLHASRHPRRWMKRS